MRSFVIDELTPDEIARITETVSEMNLNSSIERSFWFPVPKKLLNPLQQEHFINCGPYAMAFTVEDASVQLEMLVRAQKNIHCYCVAYADPRLREHMIAYLEELLLGLGIAK